MEPLEEVAAQEAAAARRRRSEQEQEARRRVRQMKSFYEHAATFVIVNLMLAVTNLLTSPSELWFLWPLLGWGVGLASHGFKVFGFGGIGSREWEERKVRELLLVSGGPAALPEDREAEAPDDVRRVAERLRNLEAIVTSVDWELLTASSRATGKEAREAILSQDADDTAAEAARLAERVR